MFFYFKICLGIFQKRTRSLLDKHFFHSGMYLNKEKQIHKSSIQNSYQKKEGTERKSLKKKGAVYQRDRGSVSTRLPRKQGKFKGYIVLHKPRYNNHYEDYADKKKRKSLKVEFTQEPFRIPKEHKSIAKKGRHKSVFLIKKRIARVRKRILIGQPGNPNAIRARIHLINNFSLPLKNRPATETFKTAITRWGDLKLRWNRIIKYDIRGYKPLSKKFFKFKKPKFVFQAHHNRHFFEHQVGYFKWWKRWIVWQKRSLRQFFFNRENRLDAKQEQLDTFLDFYPHFLSIPFFTLKTYTRACTKNIITRRYHWSIVPIFQKGRAWLWEPHQAIDVLPRLNYPWVTALFIILRSLGNSKDLKSYIAKSSYYLLSSLKLRKKYRRQLNKKWGRQRRGWRGKIRARRVFPRFATFFFSRTRVIQEIERLYRRWRKGSLQSTFFFAKKVVQNKAANARYQYTSRSLRITALRFRHLPRIQSDIYALYLKILQNGSPLEVVVGQPVRKNGKPLLKIAKIISIYMGLFSLFYKQKQINYILKQTKQDNLATTIQDFIYLSGFRTRDPLYFFNLFEEELADEEEESSVVDAIVNLVGDGPVVVKDSTNGLNVIEILDVSEEEKDKKSSDGEWQFRVEYPAVVFDEEEMLYAFFLEEEASGLVLEEEFGVDLVDAEESEVMLLEEVISITDADFMPIFKQEALDAATVEDLSIDNIYELTSSDKAEPGIATEVFEPDFKESEDGEDSNIIDLVIKNPVVNNLALEEDEAAVDDIEELDSFDKPEVQNINIETDDELGDNTVFDVNSDIDFINLPDQHNNRWLQTTFIRDFKSLFKIKILFKTLFYWLYGHKKVDYTLGIKIRKSYLQDYILQKQFIYKKSYKISVGDISHFI